MEQYLMGIDNGGTSIKCALVDLAGNEAAAYSFAAPISQPAPGFVERRLPDIWDWNCEAIRGLLAQSGVSPAQVVAVGACGFGNGICMLAADGTAAYPCVVSSDTRAVKQVAALREEGIEELYYPHTQQRFAPCHPAPLLRWFREKRPDVLTRTAHVLMIKDYVRYRLTGRLAMEVTDASNLGMIDLASRQLIFPGLAGMEHLFSPLLLSPVDLAGHVTPQAARETGLIAGTPVAAGLYDVAACAAASGLYNPDTLCILTGTWTTGCYITEDYRAGINAGATIASYLQGMYLVEDGSATSASNLDWMIKRFLVPMYPRASAQDLYKLCARILNSTLPEESEVVFVPYLYASATTPGAHGAFLNLRSHHGVEEMVRAVMEGVLFSTLRHVSALCKNTPPFTHIRLSGGITASPLWVQMLCDMLGLSLEILEGTQQTAKGAAICAGICSGYLPGFSECMPKLLHVADVFHPNMERGPIYKRKFSLYNKAISALQYFHE